MPTKKTTETVTRHDPEIRNVDGPITGDEWQVINKTAGRSYMWVHRNQNGMTARHKAQGYKFEVYSFIVGNEGKLQLEEGMPVSRDPIGISCSPEAKDANMRVEHMDHYLMSADTVTLQARQAADQRAVDEKDHRIGMASKSRPAHGVRQSTFDEHGHEGPK